MTWQFLHRQWDPVSPRVTHHADGVTVFFFCVSVVGSLLHCRHSWCRLKVIVASFIPLYRAFGPLLLCLTFFLQLLDSNFQGVAIQLPLSEIVTTFTLHHVLVLRPYVWGDGARRNPKESRGNSLVVEFRERQRLTVHACAGRSSCRSCWRHTRSCSSVSAREASRRVWWVMPAG